MSVDISIGSIVSGNSGKPLKVLAINGGVLEVLGDDGSFKVRRSAILKVIPPRPKAFKSGDRVEYVGSDLNLKTQYAGILEVRTTLGDSCSCYTPNRGRVTSWVEYSDIELAGQTIDGDYFTREALLSTPSDEQIVENIQPQLVRFLGSYQEWGIEYGEILSLSEDWGEWVQILTAGRKPISVLRSDLEFIPTTAISTTEVEVDVWG